MTRAMDWAEKHGLTNLDPRCVDVRNLYRKSHLPGAIFRPAEERPTVKADCLKMGF